MFVETTFSKLEGQVKYAVFSEMAAVDNAIKNALALTCCQFSEPQTWKPLPSMFTELMVETLASERRVGSMLYPTWCLPRRM